MKRNRPACVLAMAAAFCAPLVLTSGAATAQTGITIKISSPPPSARFEHRTPRPYTGAIWIAGHADWIDGRNVWIDGHWDRPGGNTHVWRHGYWNHGKRGVAGTSGDWH